MIGRLSPQNRTDQQCEHCKLWYSSQGITNHERHCPWQEREEDLGMLADDRSSLDTESGELDGSTDVDSVSTEAQSEGSDGGTETEPAGSAVTDWSGLGLEGPPEPSDRDVDVDDQEASTLDCTECGDPLGIDEDDLEDGAILTCECGHRMRWSDE